jgi:rSAM/selenodomain-associated transferase 2
VTLQVSIIIPTLNEEACLEKTLRCLSLLNPPPWEVFVVDAESQDGTVAIAQKNGAKVVPTERRGRSHQMNLGAAAATGEVLCFLHADTLVPDDMIQVIERTLARPQVVCGGFISLMTGTRGIRWGISLHNYLKTYYAPLFFRPHLFFFKRLRLLFGDQVMFCRRATFEACNGFDAAMPIMEEADLCRRICHHGQIHQVNRIVQSSDRRVAKWGVLKANLIYLYVGCLWGVGVSATYLKRFYEEIR